MALLICDINEFKQCNDSYGHDFGDTVLKVVAKTLEELLRTNDTVARYGGDEFVLILEDIGHSDQISKIVMTIKAAFPMTIIQDEQACKIDMSIGSACFPDNGNNFNEIIQIADQNMYQEKKYFYSLD
jgi:diguanylate cyclase (GGDEF)-like protein